MKKFLALLLVCIMALAVVSCDKGETPPPAQTPVAVDFSVFETAIDQTPAAEIKLETKLTTELGVLNSTVETVFNPNGSATVNYYIEKFNTGFETADTVIPMTGTVTLGKDGSYSDGGEFQGLIGSNPTAVNLTLDATKFASYAIDGTTLSAVVKAENTAAVFGAAIAADVNFILTVSNNRVISVVLNYTTAAGAVESIVTYI